MPLSLNPEDGTAFSNLAVTHALSGTNPARIQGTGIAVLLFALLAMHTGFAADREVQKSRLQRAADSTMQGLRGAIVVMDVSSREILAAHRLETAAQNLQRPGSTMKPLLLMELLESGLIDPQKRLRCRRPLMIGSHRLDCNHPAQVTDLDAADALAYSCNTYFSEVALRLSPDQLVKVFKRDGLDSATGYARTEATGHIVLPVRTEDLQLEALGDQGLEITGLELLEAYRRLALLRRDVNAPVDFPVFEGLENAVKFGVARGAYVEHLRVAGKTGTASSRTSAHTHGFFVGYAPADKPAIVVLVYLERGRGSDAAAVAKPIFAAFVKTAPKL